jgi:hypothetical protein
VIYSYKLIKSELAKLICIMKASIPSLMKGMKKSFVLPTNIGVKTDVNVDSLAGVRVILLRAGNSGLLFIILLVVL